MRMIGVDVGGTFTDLVLFESASRRLAIHKVPSTPDDPSRGVIDGIRQICERNGIAVGDLDTVLHASTVATNAMLEHKGARTGMVTNSGFRDVIHIGRHQRPDHYSIMQEIPWQDRPLVRRRHRMTVGGRLAPPRGEELEPLDEDGVRTAAAALARDGVEAIAVCFLFSYLDPRHEARAAEILAAALPGVFVTTSASVSPQFREFERFTTTAICAFVGPKVRGYVDNLALALVQAGARADLRIMASNGGLATPGMIAERPVVTLLSGPAAGVLGGTWVGALSGRDNLITFDVGGTSADIGIVRDGVFAEATARDTSIAGFPLLVPMIDIHTIGAGGGSIARVDRAGAFRVGPESAGADPGPAAYGKGGTLPTVTDANVVLGRLDPDNFLGGQMGLDTAAARRAIAGLASTLGLTDVEAAEGVLTILNSNMANAVRSRTVQKGIDPREFALVAFGGGGPLHAVEVAQLVGVPEVIVPMYPGITSAIGLLTTDMKYDAIRTAFQTEGSVDLVRLDADFAAMEADLADRLAADGLAADDVRFERGADCRYVGQGYELRIPVPAGTLDDAALSGVFAAFHAAHTREYGQAFPDSPIEIVNARATGIGRMPRLEQPQVPAGASLDGALIRTADCLFRVDGRLEMRPTRVYDRWRLPAGAAFDGPAIVVQQDTTTLVPPGARAVATPEGNLLITLGGLA